MPNAQEYKLLENCDASRISAGVQFRSFAPAGLHFSKCFQNLPTTGQKNVQMLPDFCPNLAQIFPKSSQDPPKLDPKGLLEPILEPCLKKAVFWTSKIRTKVTQERPKEPPDRPNPLPNEAQVPPKSDFWVNFWLVICNSITFLIFVQIFPEFHMFL